MPGLPIKKRYGLELVAGPAPEVSNVPVFHVFCRVDGIDAQIIVAGIVAGLAAIWIFTAIRLVTYARARSSVSNHLTG